MTNKDIAFVSFYDADVGQVKFCIVNRAQVQGAIDRALIITVPPDAAENSNEPITDDDARRLGGMAFLCHGKRHPELRARFQITTEHPVDWNPITPPDLGS
jgi:hypothetical protein